MKNLTVLAWLFLSITGSTFAQSGFSVNYKLSGELSGTGVLQCTPTLSYYREVESIPTKKVSQKTKSETVIGTTITSAMKRVNKEKQIALNSTKGFRRTLPSGKLEYVESDTPYRYTVEDSTLPVWAITTEQRKIGVYTCQMAKTTFHGREYKAWFTKQIQISAGPWKLSGLPGLILEAESTDGKYKFLFSSCVPIKRFPDNSIAILHKPVLAYTQYVEKYNTYYQQQANKIYTETASGFLQRFGLAQVSPVSMKVPNIEKRLEHTFVSNVKK